MCCGNKYRRYQQQSLMPGQSPMTGSGPMIQNRRAAAIDAVLEIYGKRVTNSAPVQQQPQASPQVTGTVPARHVEPTDLPGDKKVVPEPEPPAYEKVIGESAPQVVTRTLSNESHPFTMEAKADALSALPSQYQVTPNVERLLVALVSAVNAHRSGAGRRRRVWKARKQLRDELYEIEVARRTAMYGRLKCGEKCEIWSDVKRSTMSFE